MSGKLLVVTATPPNRLTMQLLGQLRDAGFTAPAECPTWIGRDEGYVEHEPSGSWIHVTPDMLKLIVGPRGKQPGYRMILPWYGLSRAEAMQIIAVHARAALDGKGD